MAWNIDLPPTIYLQGDSPHDHIQTIVNEVNAHKVVALDTETTGLSKWADIPLYWSLAWGNDRRVTMRADTLIYFNQAFLDPEKTWIFANAKYDNHILGNFGFEIAGEWHDICVMHALLYDDKPHRLKFVADHILGWTWASFEDAFGKIGKEQSAEDVILRAIKENFQLFVEYAANDAFGTLRVYEALTEQLMREFTYSLFADRPPYISTLWDFFTKVEVPYTKALWAMERRGIKVDKDKFASARPQAERKIRDLERRIVKTAGFMINPNSGDQLRDYFFRIKKLEPLSMSKGGKTGNRKPQVDAHFLETYQHVDEMAALLCEHRSYKKLLETYIIGLDELTDPWGRIHTNYNQDVARTGRLSSSDPNLQNIPRPENDEWNLRGAFITEPGWTLIDADYNQLEMRLLAAAAQEQAMIDIFNNGWDIHSGNAALMYELEYYDVAAGKKLSKHVSSMPVADLIRAAEEISPGITSRCGGDIAKHLSACAENRHGAKSIGFGLNYGMGKNKLAKDLGISVQEAEAKISKYKSTYPAVDRFMKESVELGRQYGYAFTVMGRRRNIPMITSSRKDLQAMGERLATNTSIQGSAADVCRMAQVNLYGMSLDRLYGCHMVLQVHDELVFECPKDTAEEAKACIEEVMSHPFSMDLACPLIAEAGCGDNWAQAKE